MKRFYSIATGRNVFINTFLCVVLVLSLSMTVHAAEKPDWAPSGQSYVYQNGIGGLTRVFTMSSPSYRPVISVEEYDESFTLQAKYVSAPALTMARARAAMSAGSITREPL